MTADSSRHARSWWAARRLGAAGAALLLLDDAAALAGHPNAGFAAAALLLAPGLALARLLPAPIRRSGLALLAAAPVLAFAASSVALITAARIGVALDGLSVRIVLALVVGAGLALLPLEERAVRPGAAEAALLAAALGAGVVLEARVLHGFPVPGNDWAKYLLFADEIRRHGHLLIRNPFWMLGMPFREDPAVGSIYGSFLATGGVPVGALAHGIWVFALLGIGAVFSYVRGLWGPLAGGLAALLYAVLPINQDILGWHGLANVAALAIMPLVLAGVTELLRGRLEAREAAGLGLLLVGLAAAHRLTISVTVAGLAPAVLVALLLGPRRAILRGAGATALAALVLGGGALLHLVDLNRTFGGTQGYRAYLGSKMDLDMVLLDLTRWFSLAAGLAAAWALWRLRRRPELGVPLALLAVLAALSYSWLVHLPLYYVRMAYYLPLALVPLLAVALAGGADRRRAALGTAAGVVLCGAMAISAWGRAADVRAYYAFSDTQSLAGLDRVAALLRPGEPVVADRCWSFQATWLLHTPTLAALYTEDIQPKAEVRRAQQAQSILDGTPAGVRLARRLGVRFLLVDPTCIDPSNHPMEPPLVGDPRYVSRRLVVLELPPDPRRGGPA